MGSENGQESPSGNEIEANEDLKKQIKNIIDRAEARIADVTADDDHYENGKLVKGRYQEAGTIRSEAYTEIKNLIYR